MNEVFISVDEAVSILDGGGNVAIPTETVYGLAAKISNESALRSIFEIKNRPFFDPLIVHVSSMDQARSLTSAWTPLVQTLAEKFWPGPLTLVLPKTKQVSDLITSGLDTVAIRMPRHPLALEIIKKLGEPLAAPSANRFGKTSPSAALHVAQEFNHRVPVVEGGNCDVGIESTIIKIEERGEVTSPTRLQVQFLRYGAIVEADIRAVLNDRTKEIIFTHPGSKIEAPGQIKHHYMPPIPLIMIDEKIWKSKGSDINSINKEFRTNFCHPSILQLSDKPEQAARELYSQLRACSTEPFDSIVFIKTSKHQGEFWRALLDRLRRAATFHLEEDGGH